MPFSKISGVYVYDLTLQQLVLRLLAIFSIVSLHGYALSVCAIALGDPTPRIDGRLSLSPLVQVDLFGLLAGIVYQLGWSRNIKINRSNLKFGQWGLILCWLTPLLLVFLFGWTLQFLNPFMQIYLDPASGQDVQMFLTETGRLSIWFTLLNLFPLPPLAGAILWSETKWGRISNRYSFILGAMMILLIASGIFIKIFMPTYLMITSLLNIH